MKRIICVLVLCICMPMQLFAADLGGLNTDTKIEYFVPRNPDPEDVKAYQEYLAEQQRLQEKPKKSAGDSGTNWYFWGGLGLVAVAVGVVALGGSKGGGGAVSSGGAVTTSAVTGSW